MTATPRQPGEFCWFDVMTRDLAGTKALFSKLFGWTYKEEPIPGGTITIAKCGDATAGALHDLTKDPRGQGVPPHWGVHVMTESADATAKAVTAHGGKLVAPVMDIMENGRMCVFSDPLGAVLCAWEPKKERGMDIDPMEHGAPSWIELMTTDVARAGAFYASVFGWTPESKRGSHYTEFKSRGESVAGMMAITPEMGPMPPHWGCYTTVRDCDATARDCAAAGGKILMPPTDVAGVGRFAVLQTADGVTFSVITYAFAH